LRACCSKVVAILFWWKTRLLFRQSRYYDLIHWAAVTGLGQSAANNNTCIDIVLPHAHAPCLMGVMALFCNGLQNVV
jgi:hypothetical protein